MTKKVLIVKFDSIYFFEWIFGREFKRKSTSIKQLYIDLAPKPVIKRIWSFKTAEKGVFTTSETSDLSSL